MNLHDIEAAAAQRLEADRTAKIESIKSLAEAATAVADLRRDLAQAEGRHTSAYRNAVKLGWTDADIRHFGIDQPGKKPSGRPRKTAAVAGPSEPAESAGHSY